MTISRPRLGSPLRFGYSLAVVALILLTCNTSPACAGEKIKLFNGRDLSGWTGDEKVWSVREGQIVGSSVEQPIQANTFLLWQGYRQDGRQDSIVEDFRLTFKFRLEGDNNSGVQYRSRRADPKTWQVIGYQADIHPRAEYTGMLYGEGTDRAIIAERGQKVVIKNEKVVTPLPGQTTPLDPLDLSKWHEFTIDARGNRLIHKIDGRVTVDVTDDHEKSVRRGILALQVHAGPPMTVYFKDLVLEDFTSKGQLKVRR